MPNDYYTYPANKNQLLYLKAEMKRCNLTTKELITLSKMVGIDLPENGKSVKSWQVGQMINYLQSKPVDEVYDLIGKPTKHTFKLEISSN